MPDFSKRRSRRRWKPQPIEAISPGDKSFSAFAERCIHRGKFNGKNFACHHGNSVADTYGLGCICSKNFCPLKIEETEKPLDVDTELCTAALMANNCMRESIDSCIVEKWEVANINDYTPENSLNHVKYECYTGCVRQAPSEKENGCYKYCNTWQFYSVRLLTNFLVNTKPVELPGNIKLYKIQGLYYV